MQLNRTTSFLSSITFTLLACCSGYSASLSWNVASGDFGTAANWNPASVPTSTDFVRVTNGGIVTIADGGSYGVSNLWVGARNVNNTTGTVQITSGILSVSGAGTGANRPQVGVGVNALGRIDVNGGTFDRPNVNFMYLGGNGGQGYLTVSSGNAFIDAIRVGSDNDNVNGNGLGIIEVSGGLLVITNQITVGRDRDAGVVNITGGEVINHAVNALSGVATDDLWTIAGGNNSTGTVTIALGGTLRAEGGIRVSQAGAVGEIADGTLRINGGKLVTQRVFQGNATGTSVPRIELDGGLIEASFPTNSQGFIYGSITVRLKAGGISIDSANYDLLVKPAVLVDAGSPGGGIIKSNAGTLRLMGTNTYTGPTVVQGGGLLLASASSGGGPVTVNDGSGFGVAVSYPGATLNLASLTLNAGAGTNDFNFNLGLGNPTAPVIIATTLNVTRTNIVHITGAGLAIGQITLVQFTSASGLTSDQFQLGTLPVGVSATLVFEPNRIKLNITDAPSLHWNGVVNSDWDLTTANWLDFSTPSPTPTIYNDGLSVLFDDGATTNYVNLVQVLAPASLTVSNQALEYTFAGPGGITGGTGLRKQGTGVLILGCTTNDYAGDTVISAGTLRLGNSDMIPNGNTKGSVSLLGTLDMNGWTDGINGLNGSGVIDNSSLTPANITVGNGGILSLFSGTVTNSGGPLTLTKTGNNLLILTGTNSHSGGTTINNGIVEAGNDYVLGTGPLTIGGTANGLGLTSDGATARTFTNALVVANGPTFGNAINNGFLTFTGPIDLSAATRNFTVDSDVLSTGGSGNGAMNKLGPATLTLQGAHNWNDEVEVRNGRVVLDGAITNSNGFRPDCDQAGLTARLVLRPGSFYVLTGNSVNLRAGNDGNITATNIIDIEGTVMLPNANTTSGRIIIGQGGTIGFVNLLANGLAVVRGVSAANINGYSEFNFNGGLLQATTNNTTFMQGLSNVFVRAGGAKIDSAGFDIAVGQNLLDGGGGAGLIKLGAGALNLNGINTYLGSTIVSNGALGGSGTIVGPVLITSTGAMAPGNSVGTLTVNNTVTLQGTTVMELSRDTGTAAADLLVASVLNRGGSLVITNGGFTRLQSGDTFNLFDWTSVSGSFTSVSLPPLLAGLTWNTNNLLVDGIIRVEGTAIPPQLSPPVLTGGSFASGGSGGVAGGTYYVLATSDLGLPVSSWTPIATNLFDGSGNFSFSDPIDAQPMRFYLISLP